MKPSRCITRGITLCLASSSIITLMMLPAFGQPGPASPLASVSSERLRYPDGSRLRAQYETPNEMVGLPAAGVTGRATAARFGAAARIQARMPEGYSLLAGSTTHLPARGAPSITAATPGAPDPSEKFITLHPLAYQGVPLSRGSDYLSVVNGEGRLLVTRRRGLPTRVDSVQASVSAAEAIAVARQAAGQSFAGIDPEQTTSELQIFVDGEQNGNLAWTFSLSSGSLTEPDVRRYWVSAVGQPRVLNWESLVHHTHNGQVTGTVWAASPLLTPNPTESRELPLLEVRRSTDGVTQITGANGRYAFTTNPGSAEIRARLRGPNFFIDNQSGPTMEVAKTGTTANPIDLNFASTNEDQLAQVSGFYWANFARNVARNVLGPSDLPALRVRTNINQACNAFWDGSSINFFKAGSSGGFNCPNTAYADVILHEYGHGVDAAKGGILDGGYSEGFGDALAVLGTRQACAGRDFFGPGTCLRRASDMILWPPAPGEEVHAVGRRFAGFTWELVQQLKQTFAEDDAFDIAARLVLGSAAANPSDTVDAVRLAFIMDDNDGTLSNGSPHFRSLAAAADSRKIPRPDEPRVAGGAVVASALFPWTPAKVISTNSNIIQASIHLDRPGKLHIAANTSARSTSAVSFTTGVYNASSPNVMWTDSLREVSVPAPNQWANFSTSFTVDLPVGDHTIYWKLWISGASLTLSGGALLVEGFEPAAPVMTIASSAASPAASPATSPAVTAAPAGGGTVGFGGAARTPSIVATTDDAGRAITQWRE